VVSAEDNFKEGAWGAEAMAETFGFEENLQQKLQQLSNCG
jgi:hypothetical protein